MIDNTPRFTAHEHIDHDEGVMYSYFQRRKTCVFAAEQLNNGSMELEDLEWELEQR